MRGSLVIEAIIILSIILVVLAIFLSISQDILALSQETPWEAYRLSFQKSFSSYIKELRHEKVLREW